MVSGIALDCAMFVLGGASTLEVTFFSFGVVLANSYIAVEGDVLSTAMSVVVAGLKAVHICRRVVRSFRRDRLGIDFMEPW